MIAKQTTRYTLPYTISPEKEITDRFAEGVSNFYGYGGSEVRIFQEGNCLIVEYDHIIDTKDSVFG